MPLVLRREERVVEKDALLLHVNDRQRPMVSVNVHSDKDHVHSSKIETALPSPVLHSLVVEMLATLQQPGEEERVEHEGVASSTRRGTT